MAAPVLIYTDTESIAKEKTFLNQYLTYAQNVYNAFQGIGITVTLNQIIDLSSMVRGRPDQTSLSKRITEICVDALMAQAGNPTFNGVPIKAEKLIDLITVPDVTDIVEIALTYYNLDYNISNGLQSAYLSLVDGVINKANNADSTIESLFTYYTKTDRGAALVTQLKTMADALNDYNAFSRLKAYISANQAENIGDIKGLEYANYTYRPNLLYVQQRDL